MEYLPQGQGRGLIFQYFKAIKTKGIKRKKQNLSCFITCCCSIFMFSFISEVQSVIVFRESFQKGTRSLVIFTLFSVKNAANAIKILMTRTTLTIVNKPGPMHHHLPTLLVSLHIHGFLVFPRQKVSYIIMQSCSPGSSGLRGSEFP